MKSTIVKLILLMFQVIIFGSIIGPVIVENWISQGEELTWNGSLTSVIKGSDIWEGEDYLKLADEYCDWYNAGNYTSSDGNLALCTTFTNLNGAGAAFIFFSSFCLFLWLIWTVLLIALILKKENKVIIAFSVILPVAVCILYAIGYGVWMGSSKSNFQDLCDDLFDGDSQAETCAEKGAKFGLYTVLLNIFYVPVFILVICKKWYIENKTEENSPVRNVQIEMNNRESSPQSLPTLNIAPPTVTTLPQYHPSALNSGTTPYNEGEYQNIPVGIPVEQYQQHKQLD